MRTSLVVSVLLALVFGALLGYLGAQHSSSGSAVKTETIAQPKPVQKSLDVVLISDEDAQRLRTEHYASVGSLVDVLSLPTQFAQTEAMVALAARSDIDALIQLIAATRKVGPDSTRQRLLIISLLRFTELNAPLALEYLLSSNLDANDSQLLAVFFGAWATTDLNAALRGVRQLSHPQHIQISGDAILMAHKAHGEELAQDIVGQLPSEYSTQRYAMTALIHRAGTAPAEAFKEALLIEDLQQRGRALHSIMTTWALQDVRAAASHVLNLQNPDLRKNLVYSVAQQYVDQYPDAALEWIQTNLEDQQRDSMLRVAIGQIARHNPQRAINYLEKFPAAKRQANMPQTIATAWASNDPQAAIDWVNTQDPQQAAQALRAIARVWSTKDPEAAGRYVENLPAESRQGWIIGVAASYAQRDPPAALSWLQQYDAEQGYSAALNSILTQWAHRDPRAVLAYVERQPEAQKLSSVVVNSMSRLAQQDTAGAAAIVEAMPEGPVRQSAAGALAAQWARKDLPALDNWAAGLQSGPSRDRVIAAFVPRLNDNPERAIALINSLQSEQARARSALQLIATYKADKNQAQEVIRNVDLPAARRQQLSDSLSRD
ncbi:MAG: hypothetical protein ACR2P1_10895 [Pseudomonadales bacterium]